MTLLSMASPLKYDAQELDRIMRDSGSRVMGDEFHQSALDKEKH